MKDNTRRIGVRVLRQNWIPAFAGALFDASTQRTMKQSRVRADPVAQ